MKCPVGDRRMCRCPTISSKDARLYKRRGDARSQIMKKRKNRYGAKADNADRAMRNACVADTLSTGNWASCEYPTAKKMKGST